MQLEYPCTCWEPARINCGVCYLEILLGYSCICEMMLSFMIVTIYFVSSFI